MYKTGNEIRSLFLDFFKDREHRVTVSSSLVPQDDPTLLFTNAGMVQFKRTFLGEEKRDYVRAATSQKCVRAGGKHNDLENVGYTARHHTFFEMLGNFSFGNYFKEEAIEYAWDLLTNVFRLPKDKLWITVFRDDDEAHGIWRDKMGVPDNRIVRLGEKDNFWAMGDTGPCGPCSEIHIDRGENLGCGIATCGADCDCDRFLEIWNLVFMQYNRDASGKMTPLPKPSIDTGMGLERIASVLQNTPTNYDSDIFSPIFAEIQKLSEKALGADAADDVCMKVIADHSRAAAFLIGDGILPSNEGRGYVLRRILRRAIRYGRQLGLTKPFLHDTAGAVAKAMAEPYPELGQNMAFIGNVLSNEEIRFRETLDHGLSVLNEALEELAAKNETVIPGDVIFKLYDTYGFPVDIVEDVVRDRNITLDHVGFTAAMNRQREQSRTVVSFAGASDAVKELTAAGVKTEFLGYTGTTAKGRILLLMADGKAVEKAVEGDLIDLVSDRTSFYGESGGQAGDQGLITGPGGEMQVTDTRKDPTGLFIHHGKISRGSLSRNEPVNLAVNEDRRRATALNHSATHLLHAALRAVVGDHAKQAGSFVNAERLRFDFTHFSALTDEEIAAIEAAVNEKIRANAAICTTEMDAAAARASGATALFEEKYGDRVRVVEMGDFSRELCGGTHTGRTGDIGSFFIVSESSVAAGVRRIEAVTGQGAYDYAKERFALLNSAAKLLKDKPEAVPERVEKLLSTIKEKEKALSDLKVRMAAGETGAGSADIIKEINGTKVISRKVEADNQNALREAADRFRDKIGSGVVVLGSAFEGKVFLVAMVTKDLAKKFHAGNIVKEIAGMVGGSGGGRPDMAQAGGTDPAKLDEALERVFGIVAEKG
ncbi:MAG: alanine--tRNA ligase [Deltaproteobacteria bacterium]|nr:alanine--tRNA ligase [Deltaproteobacteria bacterium]